MLFRHSFSRARRIHSTFSFKAFTLIELFILVGILLLLACVLVPSLAHQRRHARLKACINNLKQVGVAFRVWPTDGDQFPAGVGVKFGGAKEEIEKGHVVFNFLVMSNELSTPKILVCPEDDRKRAAANFSIAFNDRNVSYFVGVDATEYFPQMFLSGDRNLAFEKKPLQPGIFVCATNRSALSWTETIHNRCGNIGLADGSVQHFDSNKLVVAAAQQECTNRLAIP